MREFSPAQVINLLRLDITTSTLIKADGTSRFAESSRKQRGSVGARCWKSSDIPSIAKAFGKFPAPKECVVIADYMSKGGVGKTTWAYNLARYLSLQGLRVLAIGTDFQRNLSKFFGVKPDQKTYSLYDVLGTETVKISKIIYPSDIPTLYFIPESNELNFLDVLLYAKTRREEMLANTLEPIKQHFDAIIIDLPAYWCQIVSNALVASDYIFAPINADDESYTALQSYLTHLNQFRKTMRKTWKAVKLIPNMIDMRAKLDLQYMTQLTTSYPNLFARSNIRRLTAVKEASALKESIIEYAPSSPIAEDIHNAVWEIWSTVLDTQDTKPDGIQANQIRSPELSAPDIQG